mmetsp:Transcript_101353/g.285883  ORF Transcript_101353/g.285883 Transcript_101353/m.285883 type:complete len:218 (-) Transcript_101353:84-737(-)
MPFPRTMRWANNANARSCAIHGRLSSPSNSPQRAEGRSGSEAQRFRRWKVQERTTSPCCPGGLPSAPPICPPSPWPASQHAPSNACRRNPKRTRWSQAPSECRRSLRPSNSRAARHLGVPPSSPHAEVLASNARPMLGLPSQPPGDRSSPQPRPTPYPCLEVLPTLRCPRRASAPRTPLPTTARCQPAKNECTASSSKQAPRRPFVARRWRCLAVAA